jgi:hypothetical protein
MGELTQPENRFPMSALPTPLRMALGTFGSLLWMYIHIQRSLQGYLRNNYRSGGAAEGRDIRKSTSLPDTHAWYVSHSNCPRGGGNRTTQRLLAEAARAEGVASSLWLVRWRFQHVPKGPLRCLANMLKPDIHLSPNWTAAYHKAYHRNASERLFLGRQVVYGVYRAKRERER